MIKRSAVTEDNEWLPLIEYSMKKGVSLSTLRRHIKANKILYRVENGRYLIFDETVDRTTTGIKSEEFQNLQIQLRKAQEEIAELKTLIAFYEASPDA